MEKSIMIEIRGNKITFIGDQKLELSQLWRHL